MLEIGVGSFRADRRPAISPLVIESLARGPDGGDAFTAMASAAASRGLVEEEEPDVRLLSRGSIRLTALARRMPLSLRRR